MIDPKKISYARELRAAGWTYPEIKEYLGISEGTASYAARDVYCPKSAEYWFPCEGEKYTAGLRYSRCLFQTPAMWKCERIGWCIKLAGVSDGWLEYLKKRARECITDKTVEEPMVYRTKDSDPHVEVFIYEI